MFKSEHPVELSFTVYDLNDLLIKHQDIVLSYNYVLDNIKPEPLQNLFTDLLEDHNNNILSLSKFIHLHDSAPADGPNKAGALKKMNLVLSSQTSNVLDLVNEMKKQEAGLEQEYIKNIRTLTKTPGLEQLMDEGFESAKNRVRKLALFIDNNCNL